MSFPIPRLNMFSLFNFDNNKKQNHLPPPKKKHLRKDLRRLVLIFKQLFILVIWINPTYTILLLEHLGFFFLSRITLGSEVSPFCLVGFCLFFGLFVLFVVFEYMTVVANIIISCIYIIIKVLCLLITVTASRKAKKKPCSYFFFLFICIKHCVA